MLFNSLDFVLFYAAVLGAAALLRHHWVWRKAMLLLASYGFYMAWSPPYVLLLLGSTLLDYAAGRAIAASDSPRRRLGWLLASCLGNLGVLLFYKYSAFVLESIALVAGPPFGVPAFIEQLVLPLGISFYTFQSLSYTIDVYRDRRVATRNALDFALYVSFFPQLVAGPILRASSFLPQLERERKASAAETLSGLDRMARGFAKKLLGADVLAGYVEQVFAAPAEFGSLNHLLALYAYAFQIYFDFSGYSDIAIGSARILGFHIPENFRLPYLARGPADFWTRWHISLSTWLRDYLYIPLGGSRSTRLRTYRNLLITMLLGGIWHGAAFGFVLWGAFHGIWLAVHRALFRDREAPRVPAWLSIPLTFHAVCLAWVLFRAASVSDALLVYRGLLDLETPLRQVSPLVLAALAGGFLSHALGASPRLAERWQGLAVDARVACWVAIAVGAFCVSSHTAEFIYFQF